MRIGHGYDVHKLAKNRKLIIGGVNIPFEKGLVGHSDADVLLHAVTDAILGAAAMGDIGTHFPDTDNKYKDIDSLYLLEESYKLIKEKNYQIVNIDGTIIAQKPKMKDYIPAMIKNIAKACNVDKSKVNIKATTEENLGFTGNGQGISAHCVCLIKKIK